MKLFNTIATLGALAAISEAAGTRSARVTSRTQFAVSRIDNIKSRISTLKNLDLKGVSISKQEKLAENMMQKSKIIQKFEGNILAQGGWWWGSWIAAVVDTAVDLSMQVAEDIGDWVADSAE